MPRRKHRSRNLLESADGWATVPGRNRPPVRLAVPALEDRLEQLSLSPPPRPPPSPPSRPRATCELLSLLAHELDGAYSILCAHPVLTPVRHALRLLHKHLRKPRGVQRRRWRRRRLVVLVLGLGSLEGATSSSSLLQLAMVLEIVDALAAGGASGEGGGEEVKVVFRDPAFTSADKAFLRQRWTVQDVGVGDVPDDCDDGGGGGEEDAAADPADTVLIAPHLDFDVLAQHLRDTRVRRRPVLLVANDLEQFMDLRVGDTKEWSAFLPFLADEEYHHQTFTVEDKGRPGIGRAFNDLAVYWRRDAVPEGEAEAEETGAEGAEAEEAEEAGVEEVEAEEAEAKGAEGNNKVSGEP